MTVKRVAGPYTSLGIPLDKVHGPELGPLRYGEVLKPRQNLKPGPRPPLQLLGSSSGPGCRHGGGAWAGSLQSQTHPGL